MILDEYIEINSHNKLKDYYINLGYDLSNSTFFVKVEHLTKNSSYFVLVKCDVENCNCIKKIRYNKYLKNINNGNYYACSAKCSRQKVLNTTFKRYGVDTYSKTSMYKEQYKKLANELGVENFNQLQSVKDKIKKTNNINYGVDYAILLKNSRDNLKRYFKENKNEIQEKKIDTNNKKYGCNNPNQNDVIKNKIKKTNILKYNVSNGKSKEVVEKTRINTIKNFKEKYKRYNIRNVDYDKKVCEVYCEICEDFFTINLRLFKDRILKSYLNPCTICQPINSYCKSNDEIEILEYIKTIYKDDILYNSFNIIKPQQLDIFLTKINLAIEFNGLYWHSDKIVDNNYHHNKTLKCIESNIEVIHIYEDNWNFNKDIIKYKIYNRIYKNKNIISNFIIRTLSNDIIINYIKMYSLYNDYVFNYNFAIVKDDIILSVILLNINKEYVDIIDICNNINYNYNTDDILIKYVKNLYNNIIYYDSLDIRNIDVFINNNFCITDTIESEFRYVINKYTYKNVDNFPKKNYRKIYYSGKVKLIYEK